MRQTLDTHEFPNLTPNGESKTLMLVYVCLRVRVRVRVCQDSLGGESKALMLVCASPCVTDASETACSLNFASRVRNVELGPAKRKGGTDIVTEMKMKVCQYVYMSFRVC